MAEIDEILLKNWGYSTFRPLQREIISSVLNGSDTLALLPTGGGKSICFQVPALAKPGLCLIVSPLIALMNDQVQNLVKKGIRAMAITSAMSKPEIDIAFSNCIYGGYKFLYVSPERLQTELFLKKIEALKISLIAVDEAHCISQWGYDFRPSYLNIVKLREYLPGVPVIAVTASATKEAVEDIRRKLEFRNDKVFRATFERKNLHYIVQQEENKQARLLKICNNIPGTGIVYVRNRRKTMEIADFLYKQNISADYYHAGLDAETRNKKQLDWINNKTRVIVSTNAFGMGIDKPDVRFVVHIDLPDSLEAYFQEAGRGGRDEKKSYAIALVQKIDILHLKENLENAFPTLEQMKQSYQAIANYYQVAVGAGQGLTVEFNLDEICAKYNLKHSILFNSMRFLEKEGYISLNDVSFEPGKIFVKAKKDEL
ncbi:MAG: RecQ family ATP-dependent DNA helicase, partial [Bacteroidia bacterium]